MSPMCFSIHHGMADLQELFVESFLRKLDVNNALLIGVFNQSERMIEKLRNSRTPLHDSFMTGLSDDGNGNVLLMKADSSDEEHAIMLQVSYRTHWTNKNKIERIITESKGIKEKTMSNLTTNIKDKNQRNTIVEFASALGFAWKCDKATHIECLKQVYLI